MDTRPTAASRSGLFRRRFRGYDISLVDAAVDGMEQRIDALEHELHDVREELSEAQAAGDEARHDLARARAELRYWNDRASYVDSEVARARRHAQEIEEAARARAEAVEADAQERSVQLIDRVCTEANSMLTAAREEAREMFLRFEVDVDMSQQKLEQLERARRTIASSMQHAMSQFAEAVRQMEQAAPAKLLVETLEQPTRRALPTFGRERALEASRRFDGTRGREADAALSSPLSAKIEDVFQEPLASEDAPVEPPVAAEQPVTAIDDPVADGLDIDTAEATALLDVTISPITPTTSKQVHNADDEFAALLLQP